MLTFTAVVKKIGINPYVSVPDEVLLQIFLEAGKSKGPIPVKGKLEGKSFIQTLVKFAGSWRLYLNTPMRVAAGKEVEDSVTVELGFDSKLRRVPVPKALADGLAKNPKAKLVFEKLSVSRQKEMNKYIGQLKTETKIHEVVSKTIEYLMSNKVKGVRS